MEALRQHKVGDLVWSPDIGAVLRRLRCQDIALGVLSLLLLYTCCLTVYRLYLSPIAAFPGPKLAAATEWYEFYFHLVKNGQFGKQVERLHEQYGPIVRISPWELSVRDSSFYRHLYVAGSTRRTNMWARGREGNGFQDSHHLTVPHNLHRERRRHLEGFLSRQGVYRLEDIIMDESRRLDERLMAVAGTGKVIHIDHAFTALTGDIIGNTACGQRPGLIDDVEFSPGWHDLLIKTVLVAPLFKCFPWLNSLIQSLPPSILQRLYPKGISSMMVGKMGKEYIETIKEQIRDDSKLTDSHAHRKKSVFHHLLTSNIPESEKSTARLQAESMVILIAGTVTSAHTLSMIVYHVLSNRGMEERLREDLKDVMACYPMRNPRWADLEKVPYLKGCVKESLRLNGLVGNLARCSPEVPLQYKQWTIPKNVPVGMSIYAMHTDSTVWTDPLKFIPERWIGDYDPRMDQHFVPFCKGSRSCLGINLAMAELYIATAIIFRPDGPRLSLFETDESDVRFVRDFVMGFPKNDSRGVRVLVH